MKKLLLLGTVAAAITMASQSAFAVAVNPNGSITVNTSTASNNTANVITSSTSSVTLGGLTINQFLDPYTPQGGISAPNNLCGTASNGCAAINAPGLFQHNDTVSMSSGTISFLSTPGSSTGISETVTLLSTLDPGDSLSFSYTSVYTQSLVPTTSSGGSLALELFGTVTGDVGGQYLTGGTADLSISCTQAGPTSAFGCSATLDTPEAVVVPPPIPEPATIALIGTGLIGLGIARRRKNV